MGAVLALILGAVFAACRLSEQQLGCPAGDGRGGVLPRGPAGRDDLHLLLRAAPPTGIVVSTYWAVVLGLMLYNGAVLAEIFRSGVMSLPKGQTEAAYALGLRKTQLMTNVLLPQAVRAMLPTIVSQLVVLLKDTALGFLIGYPELLFAARTLGSQAQFDFPIIPVAMVVAAIYIRDVPAALRVRETTWNGVSRRSPKRVDLDRWARPRRKCSADGTGTGRRWSGLAVAHERLPVAPHLIGERSSLGPGQPRRRLDRGVEPAPGWHCLSRELRRPSSWLEDLAAQPDQRVVLAVHHALLERNERVVGDLECAPGRPRAALGDVAEAKPVLLLAARWRSAASSGACQLAIRIR